MIAEAGFYILYLFYGLVFFTIGAAITSKNLRLSKLPLVRVLWILALFAFAHGLSEWLAMFMRMNIEHLQGEYFPYFIRGKFILTGLSFAFLFWFGAELLLLNRYTRLLRLGLIVLTLLITGGVILYSHVSHNFNQHEIYIRNFIALPGAIMAGFGFIRNATTVEVLSHSGARNLKIAGYAILLYGFFAGVFSSGINIGGIPIEIFRASSAFFVLHGIMHALKIFDVERKTRMEEGFKRLGQSEKMASLGKLSAGIAHEINNPLANALISVELLEADLQNQPGSAPDFKPRIDAIKCNLERAAKIAGELLFFSHSRETEMESVNLNDVIHQTFRLIGSRQKLYDFSFHLEEIPPLNGIPWKIEEVLLNLMINAMDATPQGGSIGIETRVKGRHILCLIHDSGTGMPEKDLNSAFDPFFTTKDPGKGTGLGLSICFGIMELHGGEIHMNSIPGEGTRVQLLFPLAERSS